MITVSILALKQSVLASITDARHVFTRVNAFLNESGQPSLFKVQLVGLVEKIHLNDGLFTIHPDVLMDDAEPSDLIIIPSLSGDMMSATYINKEFAPWIAGQYKNGVAIASLCSGVFLLAFSGLLKGKQCTTHWHYANEFRHFYPSAKLVDEKVITDQNGLYSSGGCNAYWNLLLHLVEKYTNREMSIRAAKYFVIDIDRNFQSPFITFNGLKDHGDEVIKNSQDHIEQHYQNKITVDQLANMFFLSRRTFERRFKKATRNTVIEYIQRVKIEASKKSLEIGRKTINEIMQDVGYTDSQTFRDVFKRIAGMSPVEYRGKYNREP